MSAIHAKALCEFIDASPTAFHAVDAMAAALRADGSIGLDETQAWSLDRGRSYFVVRGQSALIAFRLGTEAPVDSGFMLAGAHTDSPALKLRLGKNLSARGFERAPVEIYGSPIVSTWVDRPLGLAGRVLHQGKAGSETTLVNLARPVGVVPNQAIHLNRELNKGFEYNAQNHLPVLVAGPVLGSPERKPFIEAALEELGIEPGRLLAGDLYFYELGRSVILGSDGGMINASRADDLEGCHAILSAFRSSRATPWTQVAVFFDAEEVGSVAAQGADSSFLRDLLGRVCALTGTGTEGFYRALAKSFSISVDAAQGFHPSYGDKYDESFAPCLNMGPAVKANANLRYATDARSEAAFRSFCEAAGFPCQKFQSRADIAPGSTIGPMSSALSGIRTVDVGTPLLSMHSIRETIGVHDHDMMIAALERAFATAPASV